ncbi:MAG: site-2 protease family protein [Clostridia bacterium]|nr:site-2 protease family protein [Clostridia bacterium]
MISFTISALKIIFLLGFLIFIHETGHFTVAKLCHVKVNEFAIGFGPTIWKKQGKDTIYALRAIPLGGFVSMEGEEERSDSEGSFSKASIPKRIAIVSAGALVNIIFAILIYFILVLVIAKPFQDTIINRLTIAANSTGEFVLLIVDGVKQLFTGKAGLDQMTGIVGISEIVAQTNGIKEFIYMMAVISISLGVTNLLPIPALDGGRILLLVIEAIRRKPLTQELELKIQMAGFFIIIGLSVLVTCNDIIKLF